MSLVLLLNIKFINKETLPIKKKNIRSFSIGKLNALLKIFGYKGERIKNNIAKLVFFTKIKDNIIIKGAISMEKFECTIITPIYIGSTVSIIAVKIFL